MSKEYFEVASADEARRAFALDCVIRLEEGLKRIVALDERWAKQYVERAKVFEDYLKGQE